MASKKDKDAEDLAATDPGVPPMARIEGSQTNEPQGMPWTPPKSEDE